MVSTTLLKKFLKETQQAPPEFVNSSWIDSYACFYLPRCLVECFAKTYIKVFVNGNDVEYHNINDHMS